MTGTQTLLARAALGAAAAGTSIVLTGYRRLYSLPARIFDRWMVPALAISRFGLFVAIFVVLHLTPRGDIPAFYVPQANAVLHGALPYRDFASSYAPLHAFFDAVFVAVRNTPLVIILSSIAAEVLLLSLWLRTGREFLDDATVRTASLLYLASPISLQFVTVDGQDNVVIALLLAAALLLALRGRALLSGALFGLSVATIKFLPLIFAPAFFLTLPRRWRWATGASLVIGAVYGGALLLRLPILQPLSAEGQMRSAGNLSYFAESLGGFTVPARVSDILSVLVLCAISLFVARSALRRPEPLRMRIVTYGLAALTLALLLFAKKSWPPYLMLNLFPLCVVVSGTGRRPRLAIVGFALFGLVAVTAHSVWSSLLLEAPSSAFHEALLVGDRTALLFLILHTLLLAGYIWLLVRSLRLIGGERET